MLLQPPTWPLTQKHLSRALPDGGGLQLTLPFGPQRQDYENDGPSGKAPEDWFLRHRNESAHSQTPAEQLMSNVMQVVLSHGKPDAYLPHKKVA